ncbi:NAD-dependent epimerase/dehydratase family protein [Novosphingobium aerophilum]|uniref:NAD-dependent epimerase/dehydratase family protein n=1 Tax=Novosphingobium aerophilum TaxID=2839843 RepID=A0A7X1F705_9SPHN|nr:NAD-dependent epimerase/dehydratase family protein [Novosphingobium aerophilum]MBC2651541.1 NAD-dependent epimerase/dehydratase family protein [Novosphingobium aerophilum]
MQRTVLITGGAGFIGTHLARLALAAGHRVRILDNLSPQIHGADPDYRPPAGAEFMRGDVVSRADLTAALDGVEAVVHLAAETGTGQSMYEIERYYRVNVQGTAVLFDILANGPHQVGAVVLGSSRSVYGEGAYICNVCSPEGRRCYPEPRTPEQLAQNRWSPSCPVCGEPVDAVATCEGDRLSPASVYAASKLAQEDLVRVNCRALGVQPVVLRFQNVFGEGQSLKNPYTGILSIFSTRIRLGLSLPIFEDGEETRDFIHVEDVAQAILAGLNPRPDIKDTINVGSGEATTIMAVARLLSATLGGTVEPHVTAQYRVGDIRHNWADVARLRQLTGGARISLEEGIRRFAAWVATQPIPPDLLEQANAELKARGLMG